MMAAHFNLLRENGGTADGLKKALAAKPELKAEVEAEIAALAGVSPDRCVMTKEYVGALKEALAP